ncbi:MAG TPA: hypothetical protein VFY14_12120 [Streptomyces sp.]|nr:hypothetical protein [Streptomyces sp.]
MPKRYRKDEKLEEVAREHVEHLSGETAAGRTDPAAAGHRTRREETSKKKDTSAERTAESEEPGEPGGGA